MEEQKPILIYDRECALCKRFAQALDFLDKDESIVKVPLQEEWLYEKHPKLVREECEQAIHLIKPDGTIIKGAAVIEFLVVYYPGVRKFSWLVESESGKKAVGFFYDKVNELRDKMKKDCKGCNKKGR